MILGDLSEVVDFTTNSCVRLSWQMLMVIKKMNKLQGGRNGKMLPIINIGKTLLAGIVASFAVINKEWGQLTVSFLTVTSAEIDFHFLDDVYWLHFILKSNGSDN